MSVKKRKPKRKIIKNPKVRGEWVESVFMARANEEGLTVSKPWGDSRTFDFVIGRPGHFVSVQVKSTTFFLRSGYPCAVRQTNTRYARGAFDFLAAYVIPEDVWYILPARKFAGIANVTLCSTAKEARYEDYREAWHLLREAVGARAVVTQEELQPSNETLEPEPESADRFPTTAFGRLQAAMNFCKKQMQTPGTAKNEASDEDEI